MIGTGMAILGAAAISGGLGYLGSKSASKAQEQSAQDSLSFQRDVFDRNQANIQPYLKLGQDATSTLGDLSNPAAYENVLSKFRASPDYNFAFGEGIRALENSAAARGGLLGGNFARGASEYGQGFANNYLQNYINRLMGMSQLGASAATGNATANNQTGALMGNTFQNIGAANASGIVGGTNAMTGAISSGMNNYMFMNALGKSSYPQPTNILSGNLGGTGGTLGGIY